MIQITPQMRIFLAVEPVDFRKYAETVVMQSRSRNSAGRCDPSPVTCRRTSHNA